MDKDAKICVGMIAGAHGVRGLVRVRSFTEDPEALFDYAPLTDEEGRVYDLTLKSVAKDHFIAVLEGMADRDAAEALRGTRLYAPRTALPKAGSREYYEADLAGLAVTDKQGKDYGKVLALHNYGAGPFLEIGQNRKDSFMLPFTDACVPMVDIENKRNMIAPPEGWLSADEDQPSSSSPPKPGPGMSDGEHEK
jgi:16S rRNA processing protein RimM